MTFIETQLNLLLAAHNPATFPTDEELLEHEQAFFEPSLPRILIPDPSSLPPRLLADTGRLNPGKYL